MPRFKFHLEWTEDEEFFDRDRAKQNLQEIWKEIEQLAEGSAHLETFDVQRLPATGGGTKNWPDGPIEPRGVPPIPDEPGVVHPWDQGLWIFPEEHPFRWYEEQARGAERTGWSPEPEKVRQAFLDAGQKLLPEHTEPHS
jgi:hypothetical protein